MAQVRRILHRPRRLGHVADDIGLGHLLKGPAAQLAQRSVAAQKYQGRLGHRRNVDRRDSVGQSGPGRHQCDTGFAGKPSPSVGHMHRGRLVAYVDQLDVTPYARIEYRHDLIAGKCEHIPGTHRRQCLDQQVRAPRRCCHVFFSLR